MNNEQKDAVLKILSDTGSTFTEAAEKIRNILEPKKTARDYDDESPWDVLYAVEYRGGVRTWVRCGDGHGESAFSWTGAHALYRNRCKEHQNVMYRIVRYSKPEIVWPEK